MHRQVFLLKRRLLSDAKTPKLTCSKMRITTSLGFRKCRNAPAAPRAFAHVGYVDQDFLEKTRGVVSSSTDDLINTPLFRLNQLSVLYDSDDGASRKAESHGEHDRENAGDKERVVEHPLTDAGRTRIVHLHGAQKRRVGRQNEERGHGGKRSH